MPIRNYSEIVDDSIRQLAKTTNISQLGSGSKARAILEIVGSEIASQYKSAAADLRSSQPSKAARRNLDLWADIFNIERQRRTYASSPLSDLNINFYVPPSVGTFGDLVSLPSIPVGTILHTRVRNDASYIVSEVPGGLLGTSSIYYVGATALQPGSRYNVARGSLLRHDVGVPGLRCSNTFPIYNGRDDENDTQLRYRIFNAVLSLEAANDKALFLAARTVPGVGDVEIIQHLFGIGTAAILVRPVLGSYTSEAILENIRMAVRSISPSSSKVIITNPDIVGFEFKIILNYNRAITATDKASIANRATAVVSNYFRNLGIGDSVDFGVISQEVAAVDSRIKSLGESPEAFGRVYVYNSESPGKYAYRHRREIYFSPSTTAYIINAHEIGILEDSIAQPVVITHGTEG